MVRPGSKVWWSLESVPTARLNGVRHAGAASAFAERGGDEGAGPPAPATDRQTKWLRKRARRMAGGGL